MKYTLYSICFLFLFSCTGPKKIQLVNTFPLTQSEPIRLPKKENFHIYIMAGQSNMAGRGIISPEDTVSSDRVLVLNKENKWVYAKEPLHYYEPTRIGLDCGLSFGKKLSESISKEISIGIIPCAVGGSNIEQWLYDSTYRNVPLYTNFKTRVEVAKKSGIVKGILWHQGESNAGIKSYPLFKSRLMQCITMMRADCGSATLPFYVGLLAGFLKVNEFPKAKDINTDLRALSGELKNFYIIETGDLKPKADSIHFDSASQRKMGKRFAGSVLKHSY